jgi:hypothetical protein
MNKLSLVGILYNYMKIYKENFNVSSKGPSSGVTEGPASGVTKGLRSKRRYSPYRVYIQVACSFYWHYSTYTLAKYQFYQF